MRSRGIRLTVKPLGRCKAQLPRTGRPQTRPGLSRRKGRMGRSDSAPHGRTTRDDTAYHAAGGRAAARRGRPHPAAAGICAGRALRLRGRTRYSACRPHQVGQLLGAQRHIAVALSGGIAAPPARVRHHPRAVPYGAPQPLGSIPCSGRPLSRRPRTGVGGRVETLPHTLSSPRPDPHRRPAHYLTRSIPAPRRGSS